MKYISCDVLDAVAAEDLNRYAELKGFRNNYPLDVKDFAYTVFGLDLLEVNMASMNFDGIENGSEILGGLYPEGHSFMGHEKVIIVDSHINNAGRKRFTIAHEAGHYSLHVMGVDAGSAVYNRTTRPLLCRADNSRKDPLEWQADYYASAILMPETAVKSVISRERKFGTTACRDAICRLFGVSKIAAKIRLQRFGITVSDEPFKSRVNCGERQFAAMQRQYSYGYS
ncbi:MAG: ImmA/IrrE family metallo-endopeptidase [Fibrobacteres bacterium]|nr:ImmA/IrrE family metallo-endopeptidase [Fibrobacterota bacterium]